MNDVTSTAKRRGRPPKAKEVEASTIEEAGEKIVASRGGARNPQINFGQENVAPGDNSRYIRHALATYQLQPIDISDITQVQSRIEWYFDHCLTNDMKPTVTGLRNALGLSKNTLALWRNGEHRADTHMGTIKKAFDFLEELWEDYMLNGKVNPASGIFLGKNNFGYRDEQEYIITPNSPLGENGDPTTIAQKYQSALPETTIDYETTII